ncbi:MAG: single-stranded DNA-binding protein [Owenweeksia sp.]
MERTEIIGNIGKEGELKKINERWVLNFSVAVNHSYTENGEKVESTNWFNCSKWSDHKMGVAPYLTKGTSVFVSGTLNPSHYRDAQGEVVIDRKLNARLIQLISSKKEEE